MSSAVRSIGASLLALLVCSHGSAAQETSSTRTVAGAVLDARGAAGIAGARVRLSALEGGAVTDATGRFVFEAVPPGRYHVTVELDGFLPFECPSEVEVVPDADPAPVVVRYELRLATQVSTTAQAPVPRERAAGAILNTLPGRAVAVAPGALEDVMRAFQMRPGVAASQDDRNDMLVRGGGAIENAIRVDGFDVPNPNHFGAQGGSGGGFSFIAPSLIDRATLRAGGFPVEFGERASSVLDLTLRRGAADGVRGQAGASIGGAMAEAEGPIGGGAGSWLVCARRSFLDLVLKRGADVAIPNYSDFVARADSTIGSAHHVELLALGAWDDVTVNPDEPSDSLDDRQQSALVGLSVQSQWNPATLSRLYLSYARSSIDGVMHGTTTDQGSDRSTEVELRARAEISRRLARDGRLTAGLSVKQAYLRFDLTAKPFTTDFGQYRRALNSHVPFTFADFAAYTDLKLPAIGRLQVTPGIRVDRKGATRRVFVSPRLNAEYQAAGWVRMTAATGIYRQDIPYIWMGSDPRNAAIDPVRSVQSLGGFAFDLPGRTSVIIEGFDKRYSGYPVDPIEWWHVLVDASADFESPFVGRLSANGTLHARGVDASLERRFRRLDVHASYSWWRVTQKTGTWPFVFGRGRPGDYDIRDQMRLDVAYDAPGKWRAAAQFRYATGRPYTPHDARASIVTGTGRYSLMSFNGFSYPAYHRLDVRFDRTFAVRHTSLVVYAEVENVYNRDNVVLYEWSRAARADRPVYQWGRLPIGGIRWEF